MSHDDVGAAGYVAESEGLHHANLLLFSAIAALRALPYGEYLRTDHWLDFREGMLRAEPICQQCHTAKSQQIHHLSYDYLGRERAADVLVLCADCHHEWHETHKGQRLSTPVDDPIWAGSTRSFGC